MSRKRNASHPAPELFQTVFEAQARRFQTAVAVLDAATGEPITYRQLSYRANRLAHTLIERGVGAETAVGVCLERSHDLVVAAVAVLKAGGVYVPLDPELPAARLGFVDRDARLHTVVTHEAQRPKLGEAGIDESKLLSLDAKPSVLGRRQANPPCRVGPAHAAYVIYTSGSTGRPKGVVVSHASLAGYVKSGGERYAIVPGERVLQFASIGFDVAVAEIFPALGRGAAVVLRDDAMAGSIDAFFRRADELGVTVVFPATTLFDELARHAAEDPGAVPGTLRLVGLGTERLRGRSVDAWRRAVGRRVELLNLYGPTEATVDATCHDLAAELESGDGGDPPGGDPPGGDPPGGDPPIGRPVAGTEAWVVDRRLRPVADGEEGELVLAGTGLARGYLGRAAATAESFVPNPFSGTGTRLYRTGDLVRRRADGELLFAGRRDQQVKVRGFRVEPGEVEAALLDHPAVREAAVVAPEDDEGVRRLAAFLAGDGVPEAAELRRFLGRRLPAHMVPSSFVVLEELPRTASGKLDRPVLAERAAGAPAPTTRPFTAPRSDIEETLARIWCQVLRLERVGAHDDFFELGGDSILGIRIVARAHQEGLTLQPRHLFAHTTVAELAQVAGPAVSGTPAAAEAGQAEVRGPLPLTPIQHWFFERRLPEPWHFNWTRLYETREPLDPQLLASALAHLLEHHDALRLRFRDDGGSWHQEDSAFDGAVPFTHVDLTALEAGRAAEAIERTAARVQASLDLERGPLLRAVDFAVAGRAARLLVAVHHLVMDGVSWDLLFEDLETAYRRLAAGRRVVLPPKTASYKRWAERLVEEAASEATRAELDHWLEASRRPGELPLDHPAGANTVASTRTVEVRLEAAATERLLRRVPAAYRTRIDDVLLTALARAFRRFTGEGTLYLELEGHGREADNLGGESLDLARTVGWFTSASPVRLVLGDGDEPGRELLAVKEELRRMPRRGLGYGLLRYLDPSAAGAALRVLPPPRVSFNYLGQLDDAFAGSALLVRAGENPGPRHSPRGRRTQILEVTGALRDGELRFEWSYSRNLHRRETVESLAWSFVGELERLIDCCLRPGAGGYSPSDFPASGLAQEEIDRLFDGERGVEDVYPLTPAQEGILFHALYEPRSAVYHEQSSWELLRGELDATALRDAWRRLVERHPVLRSSFRWEGLERPLQVVRRGTSAPWHEEDWRALEASEQEKRLDTFLAEDRRHGFRLAEGPLLRLSLLRLGEERYRLTWTLHHVLLDGWSTSLLFDELFSTYEALRLDRPPERVRPRPFRDYVDYLAKQDDEPARRFWQRTLQGVDAPTPLVLAKGREGSGGSSAVTAVPVAGSAALKQYARLHRLTPATVVQGAWALYLARTSGRRDVVFGMTDSGRGVALAGTETMMGLLIRMLPVRVAVDDGAEASAWLRRLQEEHLERREHGHLALVEIQALAGREETTPLFESILGFHNYPGVEELLERHGRLAAGGLRYFSQTSYPLVVEAVPEGGGRLALRARHDPARFEATAARRLLRGLATVLDGLTGGAERIGEVGILSPGERHQVLFEWSASTEGDGWDVAARLEELFEAQVERSPDAPAVVYRGVATSYRELDRQAEAVARRLREMGAGPEERVAISMERTPEAIVALLGVLKAGAAYVPVDPRQPEKRQQRILAECRPVVIVRDGLDVRAGERPAPAGNQATSHDSRSMAAYLLYTSGSTGRPKGVVVEHRQVLGYLRAFATRLGLPSPGHGAGTSYALVQSLAFDSPVSVLYPALLTGGCLHLFDDDESRDPDRLAAAFDESGVDVLKITPTHLEALEDAAGRRLLPRLHLVVGGEASRRGWAEALVAEGPACAVWNHYGPTETTVGTSTFRIDSTLAASCASGVPVGRPLGNARAYVVDAALRPLPPGVPGELGLAGACLARGYFGRPAATAQAFVPDPFAPAPGGRLYKTGDLARHLAEGNLELLGRRDHQRKVRGHRVEPGEVAAALAEHPAVRRALVEPRDAHLVAWIAAGAAAGAAPERRRAWEEELLADWRSVHDLAKSAPAADPTFNTTGWVSSVTGEPLPEEEMREWVASSVGRIRELRPRRLLEIGCGQGLLLHRLASDCERYLGTDFSPAVLAGLGEVEGVELREQRADDFSGIEPGGFDTVVLSSVVQYFPSAEYLRRVLRGAVEATAVGGTIFVGDVRSLAYHEDFCAWVERRRSPSLTDAELKRRVRRRMREEKELLADPSFFTALRHELPRIREVRVRTKRGRFENEMSLFRYDVVLRLDTADGEAEAEEVETLDSPTTNDPLRALAERDLVPQLRAHLAERLPEAMLPSSYVVLDELPLLASGKIDRAALPAPEAVRDELGEAFAAPRDDVEGALAEIWGDVLGVERVGIHDSFFDLGGDSILSLRIVARAHERHLLLTPRDVFEHRTVAELATAVAGRADERPPVPQGPVTGPAPLTPIQHRFFERRLEEPWHYNWSAHLEARRPLVPGVLERAFAELLRHHDALRLRFAQNEETWRQWHTAPEDDVPFHRVDLSRAGDADRDRVMERVEASLDLEAGPLVRLVLFERGSNPQELLLVVHHLLLDGVSWPLLFEDLERAYADLVEGRPVSLPKKTTPFRDWAAGLALESRSERTRGELDFWEHQTTATRLAVDTRAGTDDLASADSVVVELDSDVTAHLLRDVHGAYRTHVEDLLLTALVRSLGRWSDADELALELEGHGREDLVAGADVSRTVGWLSTTYPVVLDLREASGEALVAVKETLRRIPRRGAGYGLLRYLDGEAAERLAAVAKPEVRFNYQGALTEPLPEASLFRTLAERESTTRRGARTHLLEIDAGLVEGRLKLEWTFSRARHHRATVEGLAASYLDELRRLIDHCRTPGAGALSPSDFPLAELDLEQLAAVSEGAPGAVEDLYPLSPMQEGMLFHARLAPESPVYVEQVSWDLDGGTDVAALRRAWARIVERHAVFRTAFPSRGPLVQVVYRRVELPWEERRLGPEEELDAFLAADRRRGLDPSTAPVMRLTLLHRDGPPRLVWTCHHLLKDGWSTALVFEELVRIYEAERRGRRPELPAARPYRDFIAWLGERDRAAAEGYWRRTLEGFTAPTPLPGDRGNGAGQEPRQAVHRLDAPTSEALTGFARRHELTTNTLVQGAWAVVLGRHAGLRDVVFGATVAGRPPELMGVERTVGCFVNTLPVRCLLDWHADTTAFLHLLQREQTAAREHESSPLVQIREWSDVPAPRPLFESILVFESFPEGAGRDLLARTDESSFSHTGYPLTVVASPGPRGLAFFALYDPVRLSGSAVTRLLRRLAMVLEALHCERRLGELPLLGRAERHQALVEWNDTAVLAPATLLDAFEARATRAPEATAVVCGGKRLSYGQLGERSLCLARQLAAHGAGRGTFVGLAVERSLEMALGVLAILRSGAACVPFDPGHPDARLADMAASVFGDGAGLVLTQASLWHRVEEWTAGTEASLVAFDDASVPAASRLPRPGRPRPGRPRPGRPRPGRDDDAYVVFTSGSTGRPKGVVVPHRTLEHLLAWLAPHLKAGASTLGYASLGFDASFTEAFSAWTTGGALHVVSEELRRDVPALYDYLKRAKIEQAVLPVLVLGRLAEEHLARGGEPLALRLVAATGEQLHVTPAMERFFEKHPEAVLHNHYGPSETHVITADVSVTRNPHFTPLIGRPIAGVRVYLAGDGGFELAGPGAVGELLVGGQAPGRGYLGQPASTAERFLPDPWGLEPGARLYRTGDLARFTDDGNLQFLGRFDQQVKVRGYRVEPEEVEAVLAGHPGVREAAVVARRGDGDSAETELVGFFVARGEPPTEEELREALAVRLPSYMVPAHLVAVDELPLTANRKVDRTALARLPLPGPREATPDALPRTAAEDVLAGIFHQVLGRDDIGIHTSFFTLGGHSLKALQVVSRVREIFHVELAVRRIFEEPTVAELAAAIEARLAAGTETADPPIQRRADPDAEAPLSFAQERLWFLQSLEPENPAYNLPLAVRLLGPLDAPALFAALGEVVRRHEVLRTTIRGDRGEGPRQVVEPAGTTPFVQIDLTGLAYAKRGVEARRTARREVLRPFEPATETLLRIAVFVLGEGEHVLFVLTHHLVFDGWSEALFYRELAELYAAFRQRRPSPLAEPPIQYADFAVWQRRRLTADHLREHLAYWRAQLGDKVPALRLPSDRPRPARRSPHGSACELVFPAEVSDRLANLAGERSASLFMTLLAALWSWLYRLTGQGDLALGTPVVERNRHDLETLVGQLTNTLVLRGRPGTDPAFHEVLDQARKTVLGAFAHQEMPFELLVEDLDPRRDLATHPLFEVIFTCDENPRPLRRLAGVAVTDFDLGAWPVHVRFDLEVYFWRDAGRLRAVLAGRRDLFDATTLRRLARSLSTLVEHGAAQPATRLSRLEILPKAERHQALCEWNASPAVAGDGELLHELFAAEGRRRGEAIAVVGEDGARLTYGQLERRANHLAERLRGLGVGPEARVGLLLERSPDLVIALLAVLKAGGAYVPLDPSYPSEHLEQTTRDANLTVLVSAAAAGLCAPPEVVHLVLDAEGLAEEREAPPRIRIHPDSPAYAIYTSGSTGRPKAAVLTHRNVTRLFAATRGLFGFGEDDVWTLVHSFAFDFSVWEIWGALLHGGRLVVVSRASSRSPEELHRVLTEHAVTVLSQTPSAFRQLVGAVPDPPASLRLVVFGGEAVDLEAATAWRRRERPVLVNMYGITETTVHVTSRRLAAGLNDAGGSVVGRPLPHLAAHVLDAGLAPLPAGVAGELFVAGEGLARGYLDEPARTAERFLPDPFGESGSRLYRTGDRFRRDAGGELRFLGRADDQVKVRGYRVEPGEVEAVLAEHPGVARAAVVSRDFGVGDRRLLAFLVPDSRHALGVRRLIALDEQEAASLHRLDDGVALFHRSRSETDLLYHEIFRERSYLRGGLVLHPGDRVFDVGANIGLFSLFVAREVGDVALYVFEPVPAVFELLRRNVRLWGLDGARLYECALGGQAGTMEVDYYPHASILSGRSRDDDGVRRTVEGFLRRSGQLDDEVALDELLDERLRSERLRCQVRTLSEVIGEAAVERIDLLKVDAEGSEAEVLAGIAEDDWPKIRQLVVEVDEGEGRLDAMAGLLRGHGYEVSTERSEMLAGTGFVNLYARRPGENDGRRAERPARWWQARSFVDDVRRHARRRLPEFMVPAHFVPLDELPRTPGGKADREALAHLPLPGPPSGAATPGSAPASPIEEVVAGTWCQVLDLPAVARDQSFFDLGGHSLHAAQVVSRLRRDLGVELDLRRFFAAPTVAALAREVMDARSHGEKAAVLEGAPRDRELPLSFAQQRLWWIDRFYPGSGAYHLPAAWELMGRLERAALEAGLREVVRRHESLRTTFPETGGSPRQEITTEVELVLPEVDLSALPHGRRRAARGLVARETARPFDLETGPLLRALLVRLGRDRHVLFTKTHHIVSDGWSLAIFHRELAALYQAALQGRPSPLAEPRLQYADFAIAQRERIRGPYLEELLDYWRTQLQGTADLELPADRPRPAIRSYRGGVRCFVLPAETTAALQALARGHAATLYMVLCAAWKALLQRLTGQDDVAVGTPVAQRDRPELETMIGFFVNTLVLRSDLGGDPGFRELLARVRDTALGAFVHQEAPFERLVEELRPQRQANRNPFFEVMLTLQNTPWEPPSLPGLRLRPWESLATVALFDLDLTWTEDGGVLYGELVYARDLFDATRAGRLESHLTTLLADAAAHPDRRLSDLAILRAAERHQLLVEWNDTTEAEAPETDVVDLFLAQVRRAPDAVAVRDAATSLSYTELAAAAGHLSRLLDAAGIGNESVVALLAERDCGFLVAVLATFMAGGAYMPLDPQHPARRLGRALEEARATLVLTSPDLQDLALDASQDAQPAIFLLEKPTRSHSVSGNEPVLRRRHADQLAYVLFTSGSTGTPKGALLTHGGLANHLRSKVRDLGLGPSDAVAQTASQCFDISVWQLLAPLAAGATVEIVEPATAEDASRLLYRIEKTGVSVLEIVPPLLRLLLAEVGRRAERPRLQELRWLIPTGEALPPELARAWLEAYPQIPLINAYGPCECTDDVCLGVHRSVNDLAARYSVPIGRPVTGLRLHLLDRRGMLVPAGVPGEITIAGLGVGRGYVHDPRRTAAAFVPTPWGDGERLYLSGDLGVRLADGRLVFLGRLDHQVKVRGHRIELGEIEASIERHPAVRAAVVVPAAESGEPRLVAYFEAHEAAGLDPGELRTHLLEELPTPMVPAAFVAVAELPSTPQGKVDRISLAERPLPGAGADRERPRSRIERELAALLGELLGRSDVGRGDDFFALGGHSLLAVRLLARIEERFGVRLPMTAFFRDTSVAALAHRLDEEVEEVPWTPLVPIRTGGSHRPLFAVHPAGGTVLCYRELAQRLGDDQPFYGLEARGFEPGESFHQNVGEMAMAYVEAVRALQEKGPYRLAGYSDGGVVAFDMARKLRAAGEEVELLVLIDAAFPDPEALEGDETAALEGFGGDLGLDANAVAHVVKARNMTFEQRLDRLFAEGRRAGFFGEDDAERLRRLHRLYRHLSEAKDRYVPRLYYGALTLVRPNSQRGRSDLAAGWMELVRRLEVCLVPGDHFSMLREPFVEELAARLQRRLAADPTRT